MDFGTALVALVDSTAEEQHSKLADFVVEVADSTRSVVVEELHSAAEEQVVDSLDFDSGCNCSWLFLFLKV